MGQLSKQYPSPSAPIFPLVISLKISSIFGWPRSSHLSFVWSFPVLDRPIRWIGLRFLYFCISIKSLSNEQTLNRIWRAFVRLFVQGRCQRTEPPCKYLHPPQHLKEQLLQNGRNNLLLKNLHWQTSAAAAAGGLHSTIVPTATVYPMVGVGGVVSTCSLLAVCWKMAAVGAIFNLTNRLYINKMNVGLWADW